MSNFRRERAGEVDGDAEGLDAAANARRDQRSAITVAGVPDIWGNSPKNIVE